MTAVAAGPAGTRRFYYPELLWGNAIAATAYLGLALAPSGLTSSVLAPLQVVLGAYLLLFVPGYALGAWMFRRYGEMPRTAHLAIAVGLSAAFNIFAGLAYLAGGVALSPLGLGLPATLVAWLGAVLFWPSGHRVRASSELTSQLREAFALPGFTRTQRRVAFALLLAILVVLGETIYVATLTPNDHPSVTLAVTGPDGTAQSLPTAARSNQVYSVLVQIDNNLTHQALTLSLEVSPTNGSVANVTPVAWALPLSLRAGAASSTQVTMLPSATFTLNVTFLFVQDGSFAMDFTLSTVGGSPLRTVSMPITVV